jgi:hypothetical protein
MDHVIGGFFVASGVKENMEGLCGVKKMQGVEVDQFRG